MSKGPGRIERAIRELFDTHPDEAFVTEDLCLACYPGIYAGARYYGDVGIVRKHRVAVMRAAGHVVEHDRDWRSLPSPEDRRMLVFCNRASVTSMIMRHHFRWSITHASVVERTRELLDRPEPVPYQRKWLDDAAHSVRAHLAIRDADPAEAKRLRAEHQSEGAKELARLGQTIRALAGRPVYVLPTAHRCPSATLTALAAQLRHLMVQNDPDAVRAGLADIADALDAMARDPAALWNR